VPSAPVLLVTGPPAAGKSTVARLVADRFGTAACVETDWFWTTIVRGHVLPWLPEADAQNRTVLRTCAAAAAELALGGYTVVMNGIIGPWFLGLVTDELWRVEADVHYVVLRPALAVTTARAAARAGEERVPGHPALTDEGPVRFMWERFRDLGPYERHVVDNGAEDPQRTADVVWTRFRDGTDRLVPPPAG